MVKCNTDETCELQGKYLYVDYLDSRRNGTIKCRKVSWRLEFPEPPSESRALERYAIIHGPQLGADNRVG